MSTRQKLKNIEPFFAATTVVVAFILVWNILGAMLAAIAITGLAALVLKIFIMACALYLNVHVGIGKAAKWFADAFVEIFFPPEQATAVAEENAAT